MSSVKLLGDFNQLLLIRLDDEKSIFHSLIGCYPVLDRVD
jgi:hypothetical protein